MAYIHQINGYDEQNDFGLGPVVSVFFNFCSFHCKGCWNESTWARKDELFMENEQVVQEILTQLEKNFIRRGLSPQISLLGGDPFVHENIDDTLEIIKQLKNRLPDLKIGGWTGFDVSNWFKRPTAYEKQLDSLHYLERVIDGPFVLALKTKSHMFGSINQRVIDCKQLLSAKGSINDRILIALAEPNDDMSVETNPGFSITPGELMKTFTKLTKPRSYIGFVLETVSG